MWLERSGNGAQWKLENVEAVAEEDELEEVRRRDHETVDG
jgi:hypothetical protein